MLDIRNLNVYHYSDGSTVMEYYDGERTGYIHHISKDGAGYVVDVTTLDENGEVQEGPRFLAPSLSAAIARIEAIENGEV